MTKAQSLTPPPEEQAARGREHMDIVIVGHVDHGKSTVIGRLLADTGSLPEGKLEQVRERCERERRPFEYAYLLDALKAEQAQGITIDTARSFFKTAKRNCIIHDAPGHIEFLKNMVTGAARAEAALLVIDAQEGIQENSKRHGYLVSMLGVRQIAVVVNKMDLEEYSQEVFDRICEDYTTFLARLGVKTVGFIPVAARHGVNITTRSTKETPWYDGPTVLEQIDAFEKPNTLGLTENVFRMPVQNIYKFTGSDDDRRIVAGTISTGTVKIHDEVIFHPSGKRTKIKSIESFHAEPATTAAAGEAVGFTMTTQIYIRPGELMCRADEEPAPRVGTRFRVNMFWMGRAPMVMGREYRLKIGAMNVLAQLADIYSVLDASELSSVANKRQIDRHDVAECVIETVRPVAFDLRNDVEQTGRFVIVDDYEISGAGVILDPVEEGESLFEKRVREREYKWEKGLVAPLDRRQRFRHSGKLVIFNGPPGSGKRDLAKRVEADLFKAGCNTYYFGIANYFQDLDRFTDAPSMTREDHLQMLGELARVMADAGLLFITTLADIDSADLERLRLLSGPNEPFVVNLGTSSLPGDAVAVQLLESPGPDDAVKAIVDALMKREVLQDYVI